MKSYNNAQHATWWNLIFEFTEFNKMNHCWPWIICVIGVMSNIGGKVEAIYSWKVETQVKWTFNNKRTASRM